MREPGFNIVLIFGTTSFVCHTINTSVKCFVEAKTPMDLAKGGCILMVAFSVSYGAYHLIKNKDI